MTKRTKMLICFPVILVIVAVIIAADIVAGIMSDSITALLCPPLPNTAELESSREMGQAMSKQILTEGAVLLKNENDVLPFSRSTKKVSLFGYRAYNPIYSGGGAGVVQPEASNDVSDNTDFTEALAEYGIEYDLMLYAAYSNVRSEVPIDNKNVFSDEVLASAKQTDTAIVVLGRYGGENSAIAHGTQSDKSAHGLEITDTERSLLEYVGAEFENVLVIINGSNQMQLNFLYEIEGLDACVNIGTPGTKGYSAIPALLWGDENFSGKLTDTLPYDFRSNINYNYTDETGTYHYTDAESYVDMDPSMRINYRAGGPAYVDNVEDIYVGYKWYETAYAEGVWDNDTRTLPYYNGESVEKTGYDAIVQYPFGYGLSYTNFEWKVEKVTVQPAEGDVRNDTITIDVNVTNKGSEPGKEVVQLYVNAPYTDGGVEKAYVNLVDFGKTITLYPEDEADNVTKFSSQTITLITTSYDLASYDCYDKNKNNHTGYELDAGVYGLWLMTDAHNVKDVTFASDGTDTPRAGKIEYEIETPVLYDYDPVTGSKVDNLFTGEDAVDGVSLDGKGEYGDNQNITYISRENFPRTLEKAENRKMTARVADYNVWDFEADAEKWDNATTDVFGESVDTSPVNWGNGGDLKIYDSSTRTVTELGLKLGDPANWDSPEWDELLSQVSRSEAITLTDISQAGNNAVDSIGKPRLSDADGPIQARGFAGSAPRGTGYPSATVIAQTYSKDIARSFGLSMARDMNAVGLDGLYGVGVNIHRTLFSGRNFEYYSEDAYLSGVMARESMLGMKKGGKYGYLKHFAVNENEYYRTGLATWMSEQALREIYLKAFGMVVRSEATTAIMSAYNRIGAVWTGGSTALLTGVLRKEWKFKGAVVTDFAAEEDRFNQWGYMNMDQAIRSGGSLAMFVQYTDNTYNSTSNRLDHALLDAVKNLTFMWLNVMYENNEYNKNPDDGMQIISLPSTPSFVWWVPLLADINVVLIGGCALAAFLVIVGKGKKKASPKGESGENAPTESGKA